MRNGVIGGGAEKGGRVQVMLDRRYTWTLDEAEEAYLRIRNGVVDAIIEDVFGYGGRSLLEQDDYMEIARKMFQQERRDGCQYLSSYSVKCLVRWIYRAAWKALQMIDGLKGSGIKDDGENSLFSKDEFPSIVRNKINHGLEKNGGMYLGPNGRSARVFPFMVRVTGCGPIPYANDNEFKPKYAITNIKLQRDGHEKDGDWVMIVSYDKKAAPFEEFVDRRGLWRKEKKEREKQEKQEMASGENNQ